ncbi:hypothetical protein M413DRAFT_439566 [Hebeloma cylindrosporum]|uniref:Uncharacterized protein n=1 Tax=Hebeloma cylindrosporum TaxID=76867 RepID=A0A0C3CGK5_HEBCY|nr:hypothetical protein M413DRAFT_439566 [Hebeloma cylindrosporum h7]
MGASDSWNSPTPIAKSKTEGQKDELSTQFDRSISIVRDYTNRFEHDYARPVLNSSWAFFDKRPISAVFIAFFSLLSFVPIITFLGTSIFVIAAFTTVALSGAAIAAFVVILGFLAVLVSILAAAFFTSITLTVLVVSAYILVRFAILVRREGASGIADWASETKRQFNGRWQNGFDHTPSDVLSDSTSNSGVIFQDTDRTSGIRDNSSKSDHDIKTRE